MLTNRYGTFLKQFQSLVEMLSGRWSGEANSRSLNQRNYPRALYKFKCDTAIRDYLMDRLAVH